METPGEAWQGGTASLIETRAVVCYWTSVLVTEREIGQRIGAAGAVLRSLYRTVVDRPLPVDVRSYPRLWSRGTGDDRKDEITGTSGRDGFFQKGGWRLP